jgi:succinate dehydrogenase/fumarate reductase flavoprotein subunit
MKGGHTVTSRRKEKRDTGRAFTLFRRETRWPGYYYRADHPKLDDAEWHVFTGSEYDAKTGEWRMSKLPVHHILQWAM